VQPARARANIALDAPVVERMPVAGFNHGPCVAFHTLEMRAPSSKNKPPGRR